MRRVVSGIMLAMVFLSMLALAFEFQPVKASGTIYIKADGSIDPPTAAISTFDNITYTVTDNIHDSIVVERDNILVNGAGCTLFGEGGGIGIYLSGRSNVTIKNTGIAAFEYGIALWEYSNSNNIFGNNVTNNDIGICVGLHGGSNNNIYWNNVTSNYECGVGLYSDSYNNSIFENNIANNGNGIDVFESNGNNVFGNDITASTNIGVGVSGFLNNIYENNITANNQYGIWLDGSNSSIIENNITNNDFGIYLRGALYNIITSNNMTANNYEGIGLDYSYNNSITENNIINNDFGFRLCDSSYNCIYHNNLIENTHQTYDYSQDNPEIPPSVNIWDDGYPSGGNYWSDYEERYPDAGEIDDSGIWDKPYVIDENNTDRYPLMMPYAALLGDLDRDRDVDEDDLWHFCGAFIDYYKIHVKDESCDFDCDCDIDEDDLWTMCGAFIDYWKQH